jgi:hypothetical protein
MKVRLEELRQDRDRWAVQAHALAHPPAPRPQLRLLVDGVVSAATSPHVNRAALILLTNHGVTFFSTNVQQNVTPEPWV